jgi:hypothetical protein
VSRRQPSVGGSASFPNLHEASTGGGKKKKNKGTTLSLSEFTTHAAPVAEGAHRARDDDAPHGAQGALRGGARPLPPRRVPLLRWSHGFHLIFIDLPPPNCLLLDDPNQTPPTWTSWCRKWHG